MKKIGIILLSLLLLLALPLSAFANDEYKHDLGNGYLYSGNCIDGFVLAFECKNCDHVEYVHDRLTEHYMDGNVCRRCGYLDETFAETELIQTIPDDVETVAPDDVIEVLTPDEAPLVSAQNGLDYVVLISAVVLLAVCTLIIISKKKRVKNEKEN
mgnify:CR=1 FL=1